MLLAVVLLLSGSVSAVVMRRADPGPVALETLVASASSAERATTLTMTSTTETVAGEQRMVMRMTSSVDNEARRGKFSIAYDGVDLPDIAGVIEGDRFLLQVPEIARGASGGKSWVGAPIGADGSGWASNPASSGTQLLQYLAGAEGEVTVVGDDDLRGVPTTHYRVGIDTAKLMDQGRAQQSAMGLVAPPGAAAPNADMTAEPADVWLDDEGRPRRLRLRLEVSAGGSRATSTTDSEYFDYGEVVTVEVPPADQVHTVANVGDAIRLLIPAFAPRP